MDYGSRMRRAAALMPSSQTAAWVTRRGPAWQTQSQIRKPKYEWGTKAPEKRPTPEDVRNLVEEVFGKLTVTSFWEKHPSKGPRHDLWAVKCTCGQHESKQTRELLEGPEEEKQCLRCRTIHDIAHKGETDEQE